MITLQRELKSTLELRLWALRAGEDGFRLLGGCDECSLLWLWASWGSAKILRLAGSMRLCLPLLAWKTEEEMASSQLVATRSPDSRRPAASGRPPA